VKFEVAIVDDIVLNSDSKFFADVGQWDGIGAIRFKKVKGIERRSTGTAFPYFSNLTNFPLRNELVYIFKLPSSKLQENTEKEVYYYLTPLNIQNHPNHNALPGIFNNDYLPESEQRDYKQTSTGATKQIADANPDLDLGNYFRENAQIKPLKKFEGDVMIEGRVGNSIRFGTTAIQDGSPLNNWSVDGYNGQPITIIRNGQGAQGQVAFLPTEENINNDNSSIYLTSSQRIPLIPSSENDYYSYTQKPQTAGNYFGDQILLSSGRLFFNSRSDSIFLSSKKTINLNSLESVNIDTDNLIVQSTTIHLGDKDATQPALYGHKTVDILEDMLTLIEALLKASTTAIAGPFPVPALNQVGTLNVGQIKQLRKQLRYLQSETVFII